MPRGVAGVTSGAGDNGLAVCADRDWAITDRAINATTTSPPAIHAVEIPPTRDGSFHMVGCFDTSTESIAWDNSTRFLLFIGALMGVIATGMMVSTGLGFVGVS